MENGKNITKKHRRSKSSSSRDNKMDCGPKYSKVSESLRFATSGSVQCSMFCGGKQCKYEGPAKWSEADMAIKGLYSSWVTDNILAMARPSTRILKKFQIIEQFQRWGITAVINLQHPGEHSNCGFGLEKGGFSYNPEDFMENGIFFYNFIWQDYGVRSLDSVLDMVKVMDFALQEGKVSVHCHAGLGRTGVLIACYLIFSLRMGPEQAIHTVRRKRPKSVQTRGQISCVQDFSQFLEPLWVIFPSCYVTGVKPFTLGKYLTRQRHMLHGYEARELKYIPKIVIVVCKRLLEICGLDSSGLYLTDSRISDKAGNEIDIKVFESSIENALDFNDHTTTNISASMEDMKGECDDCDISLSKSCDLLIKGLSSSHPSALLSYEKQSNLLSMPLRKSDSALYQVHSKEVVKDLQLEEHGSQKFGLEEAYHHVNAACEIKMSKPTEKQPNEQTEEQDILQAENKAKNFDKMNFGQRSEKFTKAELVAKAISSNSELDDEATVKVRRLQRLLNESNEGWSIVKEESNPNILVALMFTWINFLTEPVLSVSDVKNLVEIGDNSSKVLLTLNKEQRGICECIFVMVFKLNPVSKKIRDEALLKIVTILTQNKRSLNATGDSNHAESNESTNTNSVERPEIEDSLSSSLVSKFLKLLTSLYANWLNEQV